MSWPRNSGLPDDASTSGALSSRRLNLAKKRRARVYPCISPAKRNPSAKALARREGDGGGFFEGCLAKSRGSTPAQQQLWREDIYEHIQELMPLQGRLSMGHLVRLGRGSGKGFSRALA